MTTDLGPLELYINVDYLSARRLQYVCSCGTPFGADDFLDAGAEVTAGLTRRLPCPMNP